MLTEEQQKRLALMGAEIPNFQSRWEWVCRNGLEIEVIEDTFKDLCENDELSMEEAFNMACFEWDL